MRRLLYQISSGKPMLTYCIMGVMILGLIFALFKTDAVENWYDIYFNGSSKVETVDRVLSVDAPPTISLMNIVGSVLITKGGDNQHITVHATKRAATSSLLSTLSVDIVQSGNDIRINGLGITSEFSPAGGNSRSIDITIEMPQSINMLSVETFTAKSPVRIENMSGSINIYTESSSIELINCYGSIMAKTFNGDISTVGGTVPIQIEKGVSLARPK